MTLVSVSTPTGREPERLVTTPTEESSSRGTSICFGRFSFFNSSSSCLRIPTTVLVPVDRIRGEKQQYLILSLLLNDK